MAQLLYLSKDDHGLPDDTVHSPLPLNPPDPDTSEDEDEDRFFAGLTRRLTQSKSFAGIPSRRLAAPPYLIEENHEVKSTLSGATHCLTPMGVSQFRVPFPSETERFDLAIRSAALELPNLKMAPQEEQQHLGTRYSEKRASPFPLPPDQDRLPWTHDPFLLPVSPSTLQRRQAGEGAVMNLRHETLLMGQQRRGQQQQIRSQLGRSGLAAGSRFMRTCSFPEPEWTSKVLPCRNVSVPKRGCTGTGVFLPRGYGDVAVESRRNSVNVLKCSTPTVIVPAKVALALNMNVQLQDHSGWLLARRNALLMQQRRLMPDGSLNHHEPCLLPQEWTY